MKAAFLVAPLTFEVRETNPLSLPLDGILLKVKACSICGSDLRRWKEGPPEGTKEIISGHEIAGDVIEVGKNTTRYKVGDRLAFSPDVHCGHCFYCSRGLYNLCNDQRLIGITPEYPGGFSEMMAVDGNVLENGIIHPIPQGLSYDLAALAEPLSSVLAMHDRVGTTLGDTVVIMGGGPIGCLHIAVAKARGCSVILSEPSAERREMAAPFAPNLVVDPFNQDLKDEVLQFTDGRGAELAVCANPIAATHTQAVEIVRKRGVVALFGGLPKANPMTSLNANLIHYNEIGIIGAFSYHPRFHEMALDVISKGLIPAQQLITHTMSLDEIGKAFEIASSGQALKVMITM
jgi:L-iditol 2-dehydrogenase